MTPHDTDTNTLTQILKWCGSAGAGAALLKIGDLLIKKYEVSKLTEGGKPHTNFEELFDLYTASREDLKSQEIRMIRFEERLKLSDKALSDSDEQNRTLYKKLCDAEDVARSKQLQLTAKEIELQSSQRELSEAKRDYQRVITALREEVKNLQDRVNELILNAHRTSE